MGAESHRMTQNDVRFVHPGIFLGLVRSPWMTCLPHQLWTFQGDGRPGMTAAELLTVYVKLLFCCVTLLPFCTILGFYAPKTCVAGRLVRRAWAQSQVHRWFSHLCYACRTEGLLLLAHAYGHGSAHDVVSKFQSLFRDSWGSGPTAQLIPNFNDLRWDPPDPAAWHGSTILNTCLSHNDKP